MANGSSSSSLQPTLDALEKRDWLGAKLELEAFLAQDDRDDTIKRLGREVEELKAKLLKEEERNADLQASVNLGLPHQNRKGTGAHYASKIKKLGFGRAEALSVLIEYGAKDYATGLTTDQVAQHAKEGRDWRRIPYPEDLAHSLGGRLSELQGLRLVRSETNAVEMKDEAEQKFRTASKGEERWFLTAAGQSIETPSEDMDPHEVLLGYETRSRSAVSPIIATLLLIAIAVAAGIIVYVFVGGLSGALTRFSTTSTTTSASGTGLGYPDYTLYYVGGIVLVLVATAVAGLILRRRHDMKSAAEGKEA